MINTSVNLVSPWINYFKEIEVLFKDDPDISKIIFDNDTNIIKLYVDDQDKADALGHILPNRKTFGNVEIKIQIIPANLAEAPRIEIFKKAFDKNPVVSDIVHVDGTFGFSANYVVFRPEVVQYHNDDLSDIDGKRSCLFEDIAKEVIGEENGLFFCTELVKK